MAKQLKPDSQNRGANSSGDRANVQLDFKEIGATSRTLNSSLGNK